MSANVFLYGDKQLFTVPRIRTKTILFFVAVTKRDALSFDTSHRLG